MAKWGAKRHEQACRRETQALYNGVGEAAAHTIDIKQSSMGMAGVA